MKSRRTWQQHIIIVHVRRRNSRLDVTHTFSNCPKTPTHTELSSVISTLSHTLIQRRQDQSFTHTGCDRVSFRSIRRQYSPNRPQQTPATNNTGKSCLMRLSRDSDHPTDIHRVCVMLHYLYMRGCDVRGLVVASECVGKPWKSHNTDQRTYWLYLKYKYVTQSALWDNNHSKHLSDASGYQLTCVWVTDDKRSSALSYRFNERTHLGRTQSTVQTNTDRGRENTTLTNINL